MFGNKDLDRNFFWFGFVVLCGFFGFAINHAVMPPAQTKSGSAASGDSSIPLRFTQNDARRSLRRIYTSQIGVREKTGHNDGPDVEEYLRYIGLPKGYSYCAAYVCWCLHEASIGSPRNGWAPALFPLKKVIWTRTVGGRTPQTGDVFGLYFSELTRIGHCGFVDSWDGTWMISVEANTNNTGAIPSEEDPSHPIRAGPGEGVYRKKRLIKTIYKVADWISHN